MDALNSFQGSSSLDVTMEDRASAQPKCGHLPIAYEAKRAAVHEELKRVNKLPATSTYASHRLRVLNKILQLLSLQRSTSQDMELELLFAGLSL
ncbi:uncharacterized protein LOC133782620 [Humulus lupulus]|uniref:uncharacterized protein LOC133782620 n=1 Tax=Humulus lupulus TaxID=3486 RepID=UPI002B413E89|nr:uncharacterized protein LOC133782620 [Humulus lupulus]XP_062077939.1 uncharacterized protein LOC133782620 [Humulus lupulus]XP_062077941.1 uncharacterized protein LOC133782620 [Humulus lupulus]XP_062077942.1 uncharacterized protein LOC133782620 [Humulus lupulus]